MPPTTPTTTASKRASRVGHHTQEQRPRARRRLPTRSAESSEKEDDMSEVQGPGNIQGDAGSMEGVLQRSASNDTPGSHIDHGKSIAEKETPAAESPHRSKRQDRDSGTQQPPGNQHVPTQGHVDLVPSWIRERYAESPVAPPLPSMMAQKYELWKDDLEFVTERELYWGTAAPRQTDQRMESHQSAENGDEQVRVKRRKYPSCAPCLVQRRKCSKEKPVCAQCIPKDGVASSPAPTVCSYPIDRAFVPESKRRYARRVPNPVRNKLLETNLAVVLEQQYSALYVGEDDSPLNDEGPSNSGMPAEEPSNDGSWKVGVQGEHGLDEETEVAIKESARSEWLAKALFAEDEGRGYHTAKIPRKRGRPPKVREDGEAPVKIRRPVGRPWKVRTEEEPIKVRRPVGRPRKEPEPVYIRRRRVHARKGPADPHESDESHDSDEFHESDESHESEERHEPDEPHNRVKSASRKGQDAKPKPKADLKAKSKARDNDKDKGTPAVRRREFSRQVMVRYLKDTTRKLNALSTWTEGPTTPTGGQEHEETEAIAGVKKERGMKSTTPVIPKYKEQIASTFRPWVAQKDEKVSFSACELPDTRFLQALHYYASYYYTHVHPSPDMFEAMDLTSQIALGMIVQEIISDFAFKLGKDSQLEDIQVKVDKLVAAQHGDKWDDNFLEYLESQTADESSRPKKPSKKSQHSGAEDEPVESADESGPADPELSGDDDISNDPRLWDELEELRRTTTSLGVGTVKELVNHTRFNIGEDGALEPFETHLDQEEIGRRFSMSSLHTDSDSVISDDSDADLSRAGYGDRLAQSILNVPHETPFRKAFDSDSEIGQTDEEDTEMPVRNLTKSTTGGSQTGNFNQGDDDMPEIDFSPSILTQLSNSRFGSQPVFGQDALSSDDDDGSDGSTGPAFVLSQVIQDGDNESSESEGERVSPESDSEQEKAVSQKEDRNDNEEASEKDERDEKELSEKDSDVDEDEHMQENDDISPSVLTQVSATRFGSAFKLSQDYSSSDDEDAFNSSSGRFLVQSQLVQDDSDDDSSEVQEDSSSSDSEQEKDNDEGKGSVAAKDKEESKPIKEGRAEDDDEAEEGEEMEEGGSSESPELPEHPAERATEDSDVEMEPVEEKERTETVEGTSTREQSRAGSEADVDMESEESDQGEPSQQVVTTVKATRFGSQFSASYNAGDDDESEEEGVVYGGTQSQVVDDDSTSEEENVQESSASDED